MKTPANASIVFLPVAAAAAFLALLAAAFFGPGRHGPDLQTADPVSAPKTETVPEPAVSLASPSAFAPAGLMSATDRTANSSFTSGNAASIGVPWNGLQTNFASADFANRQTSGTPAPSAVVSIEPLAGGDRTDGPVGDPTP